MLETQVGPAGAERDSSSQPATRTGEPSARLIVVLLVVGFLANVVWRLWLSRGVTVPIGHTDEDSYLNAARALAGGPGGWSSENNLLRRVGYPLVISPAFLGDHDFATSYRLVQGMNAVLNATLLPLVYLLGRSMFGFGRWRAYLVAMAMAVVPSAVFYSELALTDALLAPLTVAWLLLLFHWLRRPTSWGLAVASTAVAGGYYMIHVRGVVVVGVHLALVLLLAYRKMIPWRLFGVAALTAALFAALNQGVILLLGDKLYLGAGDPGAQAIHSITTAGGLKALAIMISTQLWYACVTSFGLAFLAWLLTARLARQRTGDQALRWTLIAAFTATVGVVVGCSVILAGTSASVLDVLYGRYVSAFVPFWTIAGLAVVSAVSRRTLAYWGLLSAAVLVAGGAVTQLRLSRAESHGKPLRYGLFTAPDLLAMSNGWRVFYPLIAVGVALGLFVLILVFWRTRRAQVVALLVLATANIAIMISLQGPTSDLVRNSTPASTLAALGVREGDTVATTYGYNYFLRLNLQHEVTWTDARTFGKEPPVGTDYVIAAYLPGQPADWDGTARGYHLVRAFADQQWALWRKD